MALKDAKTVGSTFANEERWVSVVYDFAQDTGAVADYDVLTADGAIIITDFYAKVHTAVTSADALVMDLGVGDGGTEIWSNKTVASLEVGTVHPAGALFKLKVPSASKIVLGIEAFAATAGKVEFFFKVKKY
jgi:hypothetical protein